MQAASPLPPKFEYVCPEEGQVVTRGMTFLNSQGNTITVGEKSDISKYVQNYRFNEETGALTVKLQDKCVHIFYPNGELNVSASQPAILGTDAVLNQLAIAFFAVPVKNSEAVDVIGLVDGQKHDPRLYLAQEISYYRTHFDDRETRRIDFSKITDFAFNNATYSIANDGNKFQISLKLQYVKNPSILYAIHDVLGKNLKITRDVTPPKEIKVINSLYDALANLDLGKDSK